MEAAREGDLRVVAVFERELGEVVVLEGEGDLREIIAGARFGAGEDDVFHAAAAQVLRALLAHAPANGVDDVRFPAAVRADDAHHLVVKIDHGAVDERLETDQLELLDFHPLGFLGAGIFPNCFEKSRSCI